MTNPEKSPRKLADQELNGLLSNWYGLTPRRIASLIGEKFRRIGYLA